jgi:hypothetical protein
MNTQEKELIPSIEDKRIRTTLNLRKTHIDGLSKIAKDHTMTLTAMMDKAFTVALSLFNSTSNVDSMLSQTNCYIFNRDLGRVVSLLPIEKVKDMTPYQKAYLYCKLRDIGDRERVFNALKLDVPMQEIDAMNTVLDKAARFNGEQCIGYNIFTLANEIRAPFSVLQLEYLQMKLGTEAIAKLQQRIPERFPDLSNSKEIDKKATSDDEEMNPALETVLTVTQISKNTWEALPEEWKKRIHEAVRDGSVDLAKKLVSQALKVVGFDETVDLFPEKS